LIITKSKLNQNKKAEHIVSVFKWCENEVGIWWAAVVKASIVKAIIEKG